MSVGHKTLNEEQVSDERSIEAEIARLEYLYTKDVLRALDSTRDDGEVVSTIVREWERHRPIPGPLGSDPWLHDDEAVCPLTNLTYNRWAGCPHHYAGGDTCEQV